MVLESNANQLRKTAHNEQAAFAASWKGTAWCKAEAAEQQWSVGNTDGSHEEASCQQIGQALVT